MIAMLAVAAAFAQPVPVVAVTVDPTLSEAAQAIEAGRLDQARLMIARSIAAGRKGKEIDRLSADGAFASGRDAEALAGYEQLIASGEGSGIVAERAGIAALRLGQFDKALALITRATAAQDATWRAWNARGVIADRQSDWPAADEAYARAEAMAPGEPAVANNRGWSQLLRGNWDAALRHFDEATALGGEAARILNNLELARTALTSDLPGRRDKESAKDWAARLNDAGVAARIMGDQKRAIAAFTRALEASGSWYARAANNLESTTAAR